MSDVRPQVGEGTIVVQSIGKRFKDIHAVDGVSFQVRAGEIFGLLGENGAGKTTTLRMLATMLQPTDGGAVICGHPLTDAREVRQCVGILFGGEAGLYDRLTARENIAYFGELNGMARRDIDARIDALGRAFGFTEFLERRAGKLSKGTKQKVAFARSIVHNPGVMLFDEPTSGLDVSSIKDAQGFIAGCRDEGKAIVLSSHQMSEVEALCDRVGIMHKGKIMDVGVPDDLKAKYAMDTLDEVFERLVGRI